MDVSNAATPDPEIDLLNVDEEPDPMLPEQLHVTSVQDRDPRLDALTLNDKQDCKSYVRLAPYFGVEPRVLKAALKPKIESMYKLCIKETKRRQGSGETEVPRWTSVLEAMTRYLDSTAQAGLKNPTPAALSNFTVTLLHAWFVWNCRLELFGDHGTPFASKGIHPEGQYIRAWWVFNLLNHHLPNNKRTQKKTTAASTRDGSPRSKAAPRPDHATKLSDKSVGRTRLPSPKLVAVMDQLRRLDAGQQARTAAAKKADEAVAGTAPGGSDVAGTDRESSIGPDDSVDELSDLDAVSDFELHDIANNGDELEEEEEEEALMAELDEEGRAEYRLAVQAPAPKRKSKAKPDGSASEASPAKKKVPVTFGPRVRSALSMEKKNSARYTAPRTWKYTPDDRNARKEWFVDGKVRDSHHVQTIDWDAPTRWGKGYSSVLTRSHQRPSAPQTTTKPVPQTPTEPAPQTPTKPVPQTPTEPAPSGPAPATQTPKEPAPSGPAPEETTIQAETRRKDREAARAKRAKITLTALTYGASATKLDEPEHIQSDGDPCALARDLLIEKRFEAATEVPRVPPSDDDASRAPAVATVADEEQVESVLNPNQEDYRVKSQQAAKLMSDPRLCDPDLRGACNFFHIQDRMVPKLPGQQGEGNCWWQLNDAHRIYKLKRAALEAQLDAFYRGAILGTQVGLGKTRTAAILILHVRISGRFPALVSYT